MATATGRHRPTSVSSSSRPEISIGEVVLVGGLVMALEGFEFLLILIGLDDFFFIDVFAFLSLQFYFIMRGRRGIFMLVSNALEFIPYLGSLPLRTVGFFLTIAAERVPLAQKALEKAARFKNPSGKVKAGLRLSGSPTSQSGGKLSRPGSARPLAGGSGPRPAQERAPTEGAGSRIARVGSEIGTRTAASTARVAGAVAGHTVQAAGSAVGGAVGLIPVVGKPVGTVVSGAGKAVGKGIGYAGKAAGKFIEKSGAVAQEAWRRVDNINASRENRGKTQERKAA